MEVQFTPELEAKLTHSAAQQGSNPDELVRDLVRRYFEEEERFTAAVTRGEEALERGDVLTHAQVGKRPAVNGFGSATKRLSPEEWGTQFEEWADSFPDAPPIPDSALSRENLYPDR